MESAAGFFTAGLFDVGTTVCQDQMYPSPELPEEGLHGSTTYEGDQP